MKFLKGLLLSVLSFLLFLSLSTFGLVFSLDRTIFSEDFIITEVSRLNASALIREVTEKDLARQLPAQFQFIKEPLYSALASQEPWLKQQLAAAVHTAYGYFQGKTSRLEMTLNLEPLKVNLKESVRQAFLKLGPEQLGGMTPAQLEQYFNQYYDQAAATLPPEFGFTESDIPPDTMAQLRQIRQYYVDYFALIYYGLLGLIVLLIAGIILVHRQVRGASRELGIIFLGYGVFEYAGILLAKYFIEPSAMLPADFPPSLKAWLPGLVDNLWSPLEMFSLGCLIGGAVLVALSFVYPKVRKTT